MLDEQAISVAAHNADVYNSARGSAQKRKREKAQDQLRHRMRKRNNGPSTSMVSTRAFRSAQRDKGESTLMPGVKPLWDDGKHNSASEEWGRQEACYSTLAHPEKAGGDKRHRHGKVPLTELVGRVMQRRGHTTTQSSPMTIRALRPPVPPYGIQHRGLIRKIQPVSKRKPTSGGPYVVVLNRTSSNQASGPAETRDPRNLPPLKQHPNPADLEIATWRPELTTMHEPYVHPNAEDRSVTNYRLQMQQAIKMAELRGDFSTSTKPMHQHAPLPAIQVAYEVSDAQVGDSSVEDKAHAGGTEKDSEAHQPESKLTSLQRETFEKANRFTSSQEVLQQMQARKQAKRRKANGSDFNNPLRTRNRFTTKMKVFKADLQKARELSIIQEDQSSISDRLSRLSAGRTSAASFRSVSSLKRIEESEVPSITNKQHISGASKTESEENNKDSPTASSVGEHPDPTVPCESTITPADRDPLSQSHEMSSLPTDNSDDSADSSEDGADIEDTSDFASDLAEPTSEGLSIAQESLTNTDQSFPSQTLNAAQQQEQDMPSDVGSCDSTSASCQDDAINSDAQCINTTVTNSSQSMDQESPDDSCYHHGSNISDNCDTSVSSEEATVVVESKLAMNRNPDGLYVEKTDSHQACQGLSSNSFDLRDVILPAETVQ